VAVPACTIPDMVHTDEIRQSIKVSVDWILCVSVKLPNIRVEWLPSFQYFLYRISPLASVRPTTNLQHSENGDPEVAVAVVSVSFSLA